LIKEVILIGAGAHARVIAETIEQIPGFLIKGFLDRSSVEFSDQQNKKGYITIGDDSFLISQNNNYLFHLGLGAELLRVRNKIIHLIAKNKLSTFHVIHPSAQIAPSVSMGKGVTVLAKGLLHTNVKVGNFTCINSGAIVEHDCILGDNVFIQPGSVLGGNVTVGDNTVIGIGATISEKISLGNNCIIGGGAYVCKDVPDNVIVYGVPAKIIKKNDKY
jgi:sugar O-acyltransferase (sialic acid O-acetyltransferase NeuD family)